MVAVDTDEETGVSKLLRRGTAWEEDDGCRVKVYPRHGREWLVVKVCNEALVRSRESVL